MLALFHIRQRLGRLVKRIRPVHDGPDAVLLVKRQRLLQTVPPAVQDALYRDVSRQRERSHVEPVQLGRLAVAAAIATAAAAAVAVLAVVGAARQRPDAVDEAAKGDAPEALLQGARAAARLKDDVGAAVAGGLEHLALPRPVRLVVDGLVGAELVLGARDKVVARARHDGPEPRRLCNLQAGERHGRRALQQHRSLGEGAAAAAAAAVSDLVGADGRRRKRARPVQRRPGRGGGERETARLGVGQVLGHGDEALGGEAAVLREDAGQRQAEARRQVLLLDVAVEVALQVNGHDAGAVLEARAPGPGGVDDGAAHVGAGHDDVAGLRVVVVEDALAD